MKTKRSIPDHWDPGANITATSNPGVVRVPDRIKSPAKDILKRHEPDTEPTPEWRELGADEIPQKGDQWYDGNGWVHIQYSTKEPASRFTFPIRTRRSRP